MSHNLLDHADDPLVEPGDQSFEAVPADNSAAAAALDTAMANHELAESGDQSFGPDDFSAVPLTIIERRPGWRFVDLREMWHYRELLYFLTWRDVKVRYKQTALGAAWAVLQPFATMVVFSLFLGRLGNVSHGDWPYPLFAFAGLLPWTFFATAIAQAGSSVIGNQNLVTKVYFPRLFIPAGTVAAALVDLAIGCGMLAAMMCYYQVAPSWSLALLPMAVLGIAIAALGTGILLSALTVAYRDFRYVVPFMVQLWMFATPTIYMQADAVVSPKWHSLLPFNPAFGLIFNFRQACLGGAIDWHSFCVSFGVSAALLVAGCLYFRRVERTFADII